MREFSGEDLRGASFERVDLSDSWLRLTQFRNAEFRGVEFSDSRFHITEWSDVVLRGVEMNNVEISGDVGNLVVNGVEVGPLIEAELDRRYPERTLMRPTDADGFRRAWAAIERLWDATTERARPLGERLHESVGGEWSFIETLRHSAR